MNRQKLENYLQKNPFEQLSNIVFDLISEAIITLELKPGENINISKIAEDLDISITPVREAIIRLIDYGFIKRYPDKKGYFVSDYELNDIVNVFNARIAVEGYAAFLCAQYKKCPNIDELEKLAEDFKNSYTYDSIEYNEFQFHKLLIKSTGNEYLMEFYNLLEKKIRRYQRFVMFNLFKLSDFADPLKEDYSVQHASVINAIKQNIAHVAEYEMKNHINTGLNKILLLYNLKSNK